MSAWLTRAGAALAVLLLLAYAYAPVVTAGLAAGEFHALVDVERVLRPAVAPPPFERWGGLFEVHGLAGRPLAALSLALSRLVQPGAIDAGALGDAESLRGGVLLVTPLHGADGEVYAIAQGPVAVSGFSVRGEAASLTRGVPTNGRIANGAVVEREIAFRLGEQRSVRLALRNPDFTTAQRVAEAVNGAVGPGVARVVDPGTVRLERPDAFPGDMVALIGAIERLAVNPDQTARVVIDEASGVIVMGDDVRVSTIAIAQGSLTISVSETPQASQPAPFARRGDTVVLPRTSVEAENQNAELKIVASGVRLADLVDGLNALGATPRDMIAILQAVKAAGALQADIEVM